MTHLVLFGATRRGQLALEQLRALNPAARLTVFSFREDPWEPPFLDAMRACAATVDADFHEAKQVGADRWRAFWDSAAVDLMLAVNWRYMIPPAIYSRARRGAYVFHDSYLPAYRGFSPTVWAMINGEPYTGATLLEMAEQYDTGRIVGAARVAIGPHDTIAEVMETVTAAYLDLLAAHLPGLLAGTAPLTPQDEALASYACKLLPDDFRIDWAQSTARIYDLIRATTAPYPGAFTALEGQKLTIWRARPVDLPRYAGRIPGRVAELRPDGVVILTGDGGLLVDTVQREGEERAPAGAVITRMGLTLGR